MHSLWVLLAWVFPSRCLLLLWCYRSPVLAGYPIVCPQQMKMVHFNSVYHCLGKSFVQITRCLAEEGHITVYTSLSVVTKKQGWSYYSRKTTAAKTTTDCVPRSHLLDSQIVEYHRFTQICRLRINAQAVCTSFVAKFAHLAWSIGVSWTCVVLMCYTCCIIKKHPYAYVYYTQT